MEAHLKRATTFSSSEIWKLMTNDRSGKAFGAQGLKYIKRKKHEIKLKRSINKEVNSRATSWGIFLEQRVFQMLPVEYMLKSKDRFFHKEINNYSGCPDVIKNTDTVSDIKCPFDLEVFCDKIDSLSDINTYKEMFPEDYWQHISNAILLNSNGFDIKYFEAIIYCPYKEELQEIKDEASMFDGEQNKIAWINWADDCELPYLLKDSEYKNLNIFKFEVPQADKEALTERVLTASKLLIQ